MSGSPISSIRRLQSVVLKCTGRHVPSLDLASALLETIESGSFRFERSSLVAYHERLRNWRLADSLILAAWDRERGRMARPLRSARINVSALFLEYTKQAKVAALRPFAYTTFRIRAYELTLTSVAEARRKELAPNA